MDNQNIQPQPTPTPEPTIATTHTDQGAGKRVIILVVVVLVAVTVALSLVIYMNTNNQPATAATPSTPASLTGGSLQVTATPILTPTMVTQDADQQEMDAITIDDVDADMSSLQDDLNKL